MFFNGVSTNAYADEFSIVPNRSFKYTDSPNTRGEYAERECARVLDHLFATRSVTAQTRSRIDTHARYGKQEREPAAAALMPSDDAVRAPSSPTRDLAHTRTHHARPTRRRQATHITRAHRPHHPFDVGVVADARRRATSS